MYDNIYDIVKSRVLLITKETEPKYIEGFTGVGEYLLVIKDRKLVATIPGGLLGSFIDVVVIERIGEFDVWKNLIFSYLDSRFGKGSYVAVKGFAQPFDFYLESENDSIYIDTYDPYELQDPNTLHYYKVYQIV